MLELRGRSWRTPLLVIVVSLGWVRGAAAQPAGATGADQQNPSPLPPVPSPAIASPSEASAEPVSFDEAVRRAVEHNFDVARAATTILSAEAVLGRARAVILPTVEAHAAETVLNEAQGFDGAVTQPRNQFSAGIAITVPVLAASSWAARTQAADQVEVARLEAAEARRQVAIATAQAYLAVTAAHRQVEVDERSRDNDIAQYDYSRIRFEQGAGSRLDALRAYDVLANDAVAVERSHLVLRLSQEALGLLMAADKPIDAAEDPDFPVPPENASEDFSIRTDLQLRARQVEAAHRVLDDSWKDWVPDIVATFDPIYVSPTGDFQDSTSWRAILAARFPIYLGGERGADRKFRAAQLEATTIDLNENEMRARSEARAARAAIVAAERALVHAREAEESATEVLSITDIAFRAGARTNIELIDAQRRARDAGTTTARAEDILRRAKLDLLVALGLFGS